MRRLALLTLAFTSFASPSFAAGKKDKAEGAGSLDIYPFAAPITHGGRVVNYVFVSVRLQTAPGVDAQALKAKEPFLRDGLVRAAHRTPFGKAGVLTEVDESRVVAAALAEARRVLGAKTVVGASVKKQTPQRLHGLPAAGTRTAAR